MIWYILLAIFGFALIYFSNTYEQSSRKSSTLIKISITLGTLAGIFAIMFALIHLFPKAFGG
jgi:hypothetical protein